MYMMKAKMSIGLCFLLCSGFYVICCIFVSRYISIFCSILIASLGVLDALIKSYTQAPA